MASQITSLAIVYLTVDSDADQRNIKHQSSASLAFDGDSPVTGEFPAQMASNAEKMFSFDDVIMDIFSTFVFKVRFGRVSYIAQPPRSHRRWMFIHSFFLFNVTFEATLF